MTTKKTVKKAGAPAPKPKAKKERFEFIDRSSDTPLKRSQLDKSKPHISPVSGQASVEKMTEEELERFN